jgi:hypothetical protein
LTLWGDNEFEEWTDIEQGATGNCYIMAAMGVMSEFPEVLRDIFVTKTENDSGIYAFRFFIRGKPWLVTIDDYIPFNGPEFAATLKYAKMGNIDINQRALWGPLLEKAWAKVRGSYL